MEAGTNFTLDQVESSTDVVQAPERLEAMCHQNNCLPTVDTVKRDLHQQSEGPRSASISFSARAVVLFSGIEQTLHFMLVDIRDIKSC